jgi:uncharacterized membrane protein
LSIEHLDESPLESLLQVYVDYITFAIDIASGLIIGVVVLAAFYGALRTLHHSRIQRESEGKEIRFRLAGGLLLALDFQVGSDILKTIIVPTLSEIAILAIIVAIRIVLGWSLSKEVTGHSEDLLRK